MASQWFEIPVLSGPTCCETSDRLRGKRVLEIGVLQKCRTVVLLSG